MVEGWAGRVAEVVWVGVKALVGVKGVLTN
jgi:hypothetical protein